jgi:hypothetical protein
MLAVDTAIALIFCADVFELITEWN